MHNPDKLKGPVAAELKKFEQFFASSLKGQVPLLTLITNYILRRKGKMMRPMLVLLSARLNGVINDSTYNAAAMIEMLHTATLVHDDVVDESYMRRGFFSINALWNSKIAVLLGDYMYAKGLMLAIDHNEHALLRIVSNAAKEMSEGELLQIQKSRSLNITENLYFEIIRKKTATLIAACTEAGASSVSAEQTTVDNMKMFGEKLGIAFQIKDDLLDYDRNNKSGKPSGNDLKEKKLTLPLIHALQQCDFKEKKNILSLINKKVDSRKTVDYVVHFVERHKGLEYASEKMEEYKAAALSYLVAYPDGEVKSAMSNLVEYVVSRKK